MVKNSDGSGPEILNQVWVIFFLLGSGQGGSATPESLAKANFLSCRVKKHIFGLGQKHAGQCLIYCGSGVSLGSAGSRPISN